MNQITTPEAGAVSRDARRQELAALTFRPNGQMFQPKDGRELMDMANLMSTAGFMVKDIYRGNPGASMALIAICAPYGLNPLQVSWKTYKASKSDDAPIAFEAQVITAMLNASGAVKGGLRYRFEGEGEHRVCIASGVLVGSDEPLEVRSPPLGKITPKNSPLWKSDSDQQQCYYTGRNWARRYKPEMLLGVYDVDEMEGVRIGPDNARDVTPREGGFAAKAAAARAAPPAAADAEVVPQLPDPVDQTLPHWTSFVGYTYGAPGSAEFDEGVDAFNGGQPVTDCPYEGDEAKAIDWVAGWHGAREAKE